MHFTLLEKFEEKKKLIQQFLVVFHFMHISFLGIFAFKDNHRAIACVHSFYKKWGILQVIISINPREL